MLKNIADHLDSFLSNVAGSIAIGIKQLETGESFFRLPEEIFYAASVIKIPIMACVFDEADKGNLVLSEKIILRNEDKVTGAGVLQHLTQGLEISVYDLIMLMIIQSDNTATNILIDLVGKETIQSSMKEWGINKGEFHHKLQIVSARGENAKNMINVVEMTDFMARMAEGKIVSMKASREMIQILKYQQINDGLPALLPLPEGPIGSIPPWEIAHKTGYVTGIEHDVGLLYFPNHTFAISVLCKETSNRQDPKRVMGEIARALYDTAVSSKV